MRHIGICTQPMALVVALISTRGAQGVSEETLANACGFTGIDGLFRLKQDGTSQRGFWGSRPPAARS